MLHGEDPRSPETSALTERVVKIFYQVYNELGFLSFEAVYENAMAIALVEAGIKVAQQAPIPVYFRGWQVGDYRCDLLVEDKVILELKAVKAIKQVHQAQALHYFRASKVKVTLILNFGEKPDFKRLVFDNERKKTRVATDTRG